ncbi:outer membrane beta-barrel family protein [Flavobacterium sp. '19STA2R22 D10 B1']|uniref:outer membrane beta-barrel family protein n=1 Tax=Flavobacterium aerium TaxID=3037261 RepID=UPI00278C66C4|nr:outer membrane beta-barrel family protein [Flavobacterium sp. '19STA2R22 D10 B1']
MKRTILITFFLLFRLISHAQDTKVTLSGEVIDKEMKSGFPYANVVLKNTKSNTFVTGTITNEAGRFVLPEIQQGEYELTITYLGYKPYSRNILVGKLSSFLDLGKFELEEDANTLEEVVVEARTEEISSKMDKKTFNIQENISQQGGSALQVMRNLPSITVDQAGKVQLRGSDKVMVLIDGKQTALTGFGSQAGLDNIPASAIEKIEVINNPSAKFDANGNAGIINIIFKKNKQNGFNGKVGMTSGIGALGIKKENLPSIRPQYKLNPKNNPSLSLNYRTDKANWFFQGDLLSQKALNKNEFTDRLYNDGSIVRQQYQENRTQTATTLKMGVDLYPNENNTFSFSALYNREAHIDRGDLPYFNEDYSVRNRLWQFYEDEVNTALGLSGTYVHKFKKPGQTLNVNFNYTFHREDEKYFMTDIKPTIQGNDAFKLIADQNVTDINVDYVKPLKHGKIELGTKFRWRYIATDMLFIPGANSMLDTDADGWADYNEFIPAVYGNYVFESKNFELEAGVRLEYASIDYKIIPTHNTYKSDGYTYFQPFPNLRLTYLMNDRNKISFFYNRRVDRPDEQDLRIFPKYDDPEILKTGNPLLKPQFTQTLELGYKMNWNTGSIYSSIYHRITQDILTRILTNVPTTTVINSISQNADKGFNTGIEIILNQEVTSWFTTNVSLNGYQNRINAFTIENTYPIPISYSAKEQKNYAGNVKLNEIFKLPKQIDFQVTGVYMTSDIIPQGKIKSRFSIDLGIKKIIQKGRGELFVNVSDLTNSMRIKKEIDGDGFQIRSTDFYETQVFRLGYSYKF